MFLTNTLIMNLLIAMMNTTFEQQQETRAQEWLLDLSMRILWYQGKFPELALRMEADQQSNTMIHRGYWLSRLDDLLLVLYCLPEVHAVALLVNAARIQMAHWRLAAADGHTWMGILEVLRAGERRGSAVSAMGACWTVFRSGAMTLLLAIHNTSDKAAAFGAAAEERRRFDAWDRPGRVAMLIYRLKRLQQAMSNKKVMTRKVPEPDPAKAQEGAAPGANPQEKGASQQPKEKEGTATLPVPQVTAKGSPTAGVLEGSA